MPHFHKLLLIYISTFAPTTEGLSAEHGEPSKNFIKNFLSLQEIFFLDSLLAPPPS